MIGTPKSEDGSSQAADAAPSEFGAVEWARPVLVKLVPGTTKYERAKFAFELMKAAQDRSADDPRASR